MVDVVIIGGGLGGLSAAVRLASNKCSVTLLEQSPKLGGRCYSYVDEKTRDVVDNGQHVLLGAYHDVLRYLEIIGTRQFLKHETSLKLPFHHPEKGFADFRFSSLPKPFDVVIGMLKFRLFSFGDRRRMMNVGRFLRKWNADVEHSLANLTVDQWLKNLNQSDEVCRCFWNPIAISVMNDLPEHSSALLFARALRAAFFGTQSDSAIFIPTIGQTELYLDKAVEFIQKRNGNIRTNTEVAEVIIQNGRIEGVRLQNGESIASKFVISAVPYFSLERLIPKDYQSQMPFCNLAKFSSAPIISIHLWFDTEFMDQEFVGVIGKSVQWIFNRRKIIQENRSSGGYISCVISGAYEFIDFSKENLVEIALNDIQGIYPESKKAKLIHSVVIKEKRATLADTATIDSCRPEARTPIDNFYLAGDWTATGLPATIEGAVKSGFTAAELVLKILRE